MIFVVGTRQLSPTVLEALRGGAYLCPLCLGQGLLVGTGIRDCAGDAHPHSVSCWRCGGAGVQIDVVPKPRRLQ